ncbi:hypothetical protein DFQ28_004620 [Apophysomyces sp. BC1034]|nr:hypothetical protein DFQ28_004620 [Apophysomyces sp. BC1034]
MALPSKLKGFNLFQNGENFVGKVAEITLPKLTRKMEDWQGGGMSGPIKVDFGNEGIQMEWTAGGFMKSVLQQYGITQHDGVLLRFAGGYQAEDSTSVDAIEIVIKGRHSEIDPGTAKAKEDTAFKVTTVASYYKLSINGENIIEIDFVNMIERINGNDILATLRTAIGLNTMSTKQSAATATDLPESQVQDDPNTLTLDTPLVRGNQTIERVTLHKPKSGELRGVSLSDLVNLDVVALSKVLPRISTPTLTEADVANIDPADLVQLGGIFAGFLMPKAVKSKLGYQTE